MAAIRGPGGPKGPGGANRTSSRDAPKAAGAGGAGGGKGAKGPKAPDTVSLSPDVKLMAEMTASNEAIPEVDVARVAELKELVNSGRYEPNLDLVASGLIEEAILRSMK